MKKMILVLVLLFCLSSIYAIDDWFDLSVNLELGIIPKGHLAQYNIQEDIYADMSFYGDTYFEGQFFDNMLFVGIDTKVYIWKTETGYGFHADYIHFMFTGGLRFFKNKIEIGFRHYCEHPIIAWMEDNYLSSNWERWYQEAYIKFNLKLF